MSEVRDDLPETRMGPPPWSEAPTWAYWRAMDESGKWYFYSAPPKPSGFSFHSGGSVVGQASGYSGDSRGRGWIDTREPRPTDLGDDWPGHVSPCVGQAAEQGADMAAGRDFSAAVYVSNAVPGYETLRKVLDDAYDQAARGKGVQRHGQGGLPFDRQPMQRLIDAHGLGFATGQACKKAEEADGLLSQDAARRELLGAIVYLAGAIVWMDRQEKEA